MPKTPRRSTAAAATAVLALFALTAVGCGSAGTPSADGSHPPVSAPASEPSRSASPSAAAGSPVPKGGERPSSAAPGGTKATTPRPAEAEAAGRPAARLTAVTPEGITALPGQKATDWKPDGPLSSRELHGEKITVNECAAVSGARSWQQQGYISAAKNPAGQQAFGFADQAAAAEAYRRILTAMDGCKTASRKAQAAAAVEEDAEVATTASAQDATAWSRQSTGTGGMSAADRQTNHIYAVQRGEFLVLFQFDELAERAAKPYDTRGDAELLTTLAEQTRRR
ncbi:hypothetical protein [Streptomyces sp. NRRL S-244]|uniref:hypothetical protein n=1 Tax=Streptomyces sp. NRRL S-244 TaxID=1463897 RepID=UPI00068FC1A2|nr:hypothetical protein [Streptomyces sp. NRRL S-244]